MVTPYAGVWIEILTHTCLYPWALVTPYAGVWIEICVESQISEDIWSLPTRECGLKSLLYHLRIILDRHSLRGSVD